MRCFCCNNILTPQQATRKFKETEFSDGGYVDMCDGCLSTILDDNDLEVVEGNVEDEQLFDDDGTPLED